jgi:hypothetical protein
VNSAQLLAQADDADRQADAIFSRLDAARQTETPDWRGFRPIVPVGWESRAQDASNLRRRAEWFRAEAAAVVAPAIPKSAVAALASSSPHRAPAATAEQTSQPQPEPEPDPLAALVERIMKA